MGAWSYKALDNDLASDTMSWIVDIVDYNIDLLPFVTSLLLLSEDEDLKLVGIVIMASCKVKPISDLYSCCSSFFYETTWMTIYNKAKENKDFNSKMYFYSGYMYSAIKELQNCVHLWKSEKLRKHYLDRLMKINNLSWKFVN